MSVCERIGGGYRSTRDKDSIAPVRNGQGGIASIAVCDYRTCAIEDEGQVFAWGGATQYREPDAPEEWLERERKKLRPGKVEGSEQIVGAACTGGESCAVIWLFNEFRRTSEPLKRGLVCREKNCGRPINIWDRWFCTMPI